LTGYMTAAIFLIFCIVYLGMSLGGLPFLQLDPVALLGGEKASFSWHWSCSLTGALTW